MAQRKRKPINNKQHESKISKSNLNFKAQSVGKNFHIEFKNEAQSLAWAAFKQHDVLFLSGPAGTGKALTLKSKLYTRNGPICMADAKIGLEIANPDGSFSKITGVFPQGNKQIFRVCFSDKTYVECCEDHLWSVSNSDTLSKNKIINTLFLEKNCKHKDGKPFLYIDATKPVNFDRKQYVIPPYLMGILLSEGNVTSSNVCFSSCEKHVLKIASSLLNQECIVKEKSFSKINVYKKELKILKLWGLKSYEKFIPNEYQYGAVDQRIAVLKGIVDGCGKIHKKDSISYSTNSFVMANDFCQLVYSLGGIAKIKKKDSARYKNSYHCNVKLPSDINDFILERKERFVKERKNYSPKRYISCVKRLGMEEMQCISVDHINSLYLTDNFTVTHNTHLACAFAIEQILGKEKKRIIMTRPVVEAGESLGFLPGTFEEKIDPYMMPMYDCLDKMVGKEGPWRDKIDYAMEAAPLAYMRGRSNPIDTLILTQTGYVQMGDLKIGDKVIGSDGHPTEILGVYPQGELDVYRIHFSDRTSIECSDDHLWSTMTLNEKRHNKGYSVKTTKEIRETLKNKNNQKIHRIPMASPVCFSQKDPLPFSPYVLGALLGDRNFHNKASVTLTNVDQELVDIVNRNLPDGINLVMAKARSGFVSQYRVVGKKGKRNIVRSYLSEKGLLELKSYEKFIPKEFLYADISSRVVLLRGLMDTDGSIFDHRSGNSRVQYYSTSKKLAEGVRFLVHSLGGTASIIKREFGEDDCHEYDEKTIRHCRPMYVVDMVMGEINPFFVSHKAEKFVFGKPQRLICKVDYVGKKECQCIRVAAENSLYLTEHCIVTHNTFDDAICIFDEAQNASLMQLKLFMTRFGENSKLIITGDPTQSDIGGNVALVEVMKKLKGVEGIGIVEFKNNSIVRHSLVGKIIDRLES